MIIVRKYPNRRLYNTDTSQYIKLEDIKEMILAHTEFQVVDSKAGTDLTKEVLLQIISDQETQESKSLLTNTVLKQLIRFQSSEMRGFISQYLEKSLALVLEKQENLQGLMKTLLENHPINFLGKLVDQTLGRKNSKANEPPKQD